MEPSEKSVVIMRKLSEQYARKSGRYFCVDKGVTSVVIKVCWIVGTLLFFLIYATDTSTFGQWSSNLLVYFTGSK